MVWDIEPHRPSLLRHAEVAVQPDSLRCGLATEPYASTLGCLLTC